MYTTKPYMGNIGKLHSFLSLASSIFMIALCLQEQLLSVMCAESDKKNYVM